jgi:Intron-binding protein aquarius N-terminus
MPCEASWQWRQLATLFGQPDAYLRFPPHRLVRDSDAWAADETFLREVLLTAFERRRFQTEVINAMPLYPTEAVLWDENQVPSTHYTGGGLPMYGRSACLYGRGTWSRSPTYTTHVATEKASWLCMPVCQSA